MTESMLRTEAPGGFARVVRWGVPIAMVVVGSCLIAFVGGTVMTGIGVALVAGSVVVVFAGWFGRLGADGERIREGSAREEYLRTGRWPEDGDGPK
jgi:hypothetical protein